MGITASFYRITPECFANIQSEKKMPFDEAEEIVYVDKSWDVLDGLFGGRLSAIKNKPLTWIFFPPDSFVIYEDQFMTESVRYLSPARVKEIHPLLAEISETKFLSLYDSIDFEHPRSFYPNNWKKNDQNYNYLLLHLKNLQGIFQRACENNQYIVSSIC